MTDNLATRYMQAYKDSLGFIEQHNEVRNERADIPPANVEYQQPQRIPEPIQMQPQAGRVNHGLASDVLPALHSHDFSKSAIHFNGSTLHHAERRGSGVHFGHGSAVDTRHLNGFGSAPHTGSVMGGTKFGLNDGRLEFSRPRVEKKRR